MSLQVCVVFSKLETLCDFVKHCFFFRKSNKNEEDVFEDRVQVIKGSICTVLFIHVVSSSYLFFLISECRVMSPCSKGALEGDEPVARSRAFRYVLLLFPISLLVS